MKKKTLLQIAEIVVLLAVLGFVYLRDLQSVTFHTDESHWIGSSYQFEAFVKGDFTSSAWQDNFASITNPPIPRYFIGLGRYIGGYRIPDLNQPWDATHPANWNKRNGAMPSDGLLWWSRLPMAILTVFSFLMAFLFVKQIAGRLAGYILIVFAVISPYFLLQLRRAMAESPILFLVLLAAALCWLAIQAFRRDTPWSVRRAYLYLSLSGVCIGAAGEAKINGLAVLAAVVFCVAAFFWKQRAVLKNSLRRIFLTAVLASLVTVIAFWGFYPFLWPDLIGRSLRIYENRVSEMRGQTITHPADYIDTFQKRVTLMPQRIFQDYAVFSFPGAEVLNLLLTGLGIWVCLLAVKRWWSGDGHDPAALILLAVAACASIPVFFSLLDWDRYYLFPVFFSSMLIAIALGWLAGQLAGFIQKRRTTPAAA